MKKLIISIFVIFCIFPKFAFPATGGSSIGTHMAYSCDVLDSIVGNPNYKFTDCTVWSPDASKWWIAVDGLIQATWVDNCGAGDSHYYADGYQSESPGNYYSSVPVYVQWFHYVPYIWWDPVILWGTAKHKDTSVSSTVSQSGGPWENTSYYFCM